MVAVLLCLLLGFLLGFSSCLVAVIAGEERQSKEKLEAPAKSLLPFHLPWQSVKKPEPKRPSVAAIPRSTGSWRRQRADLQREHNSKQKERDQRLAAL